jgi:hypothetical protein
MTEKQLFERLLTGVVEYNIGQVDDVTEQSLTFLRRCARLSRRRAAP